MKSFLIIIFSFLLFPTIIFAKQNLSGEIIDQTNAVIVGAEVVLTNENGEDQKTLTNQKGVFQFKLLAKGKYKLKVSAAGFADHEEEIELSSAKLSPLSILLVPSFTENVEVEELAMLDSNRAAGAISLTKREIEDLPDDPEQLAERLQQLAASVGAVPGQATVTVDGFNSNGKVPPKSAIKQVRVSPSPFSAEFDTPSFQGTTRIEVQTKPGASSLNGSAFFNYNGTAFNAREPLALERAENQTKRYGFQLGSAIIKNKAGYFIDFEKRDIDEASTVNATILDNNFQPISFIANSPNPQRLWNGSARADWQINKNHTAIFRFSSSRNKLEGLGIGGTSLAERGFDNLQTENTFRFSETAIINPKAVNEFRVGYTINRIEQNALNNQPAIIVSGAFSSGGAFLQNLNRQEKLLEIADSITLDTKQHNLKFGFQLYNRNISETRAENTNGTFYFGGNSQFSSLEQYRRAVLGLAGGIPTRYSATIGAPKISANQWYFGGFFQDEWRFNPKVTLSLGLRYEVQTAPTDTNSFAPRLSIAYTPDQKQNWVFRSRAGIFYTRNSESLVMDADRLDGQNQRQIIIESPSFPNPFLNGNIINSIQTRRIIDSDLNTPRAIILRGDFERKLPQGWRVSGSFTWTNSRYLLRSRNINAPIISALNPNPLTAPRPFGTAENILQYESSGKYRGYVIYAGVNQNSNKHFTLNLNYLYFNYKSDTESSSMLPQSSYDLANEWATQSWAFPHRVYINSNVNLPKKLNLAISFSATGGRLLNLTTGFDNNGDGNFNDRPNLSNANDLQAIRTIFGYFNPNVINGNLPRNFASLPASVNLNLNLSRTFTFGKAKGNKESPYKLTANIRANNVLNRTNVSDLVSVVSSQFLGRVTSASQARRIELGLRFAF